MEIKNYFSWDILDNTLELLLSSSSAVSLCCKNKLPTSFSVDDDGDDGDDRSKGEQCACHMQGEQH